MSFLSLSEIEKKLYHLIVSKRHKIVLVVVSGFLIWGASALPYFNLFLNKELAFYLILIFLLIIFNLNIKSLFIFNTVLLIPTFFFQMINRVETAEFLANGIYFIFVAGVLKGIISVSKTKSKSE